MTANTATAPVGTKMWSVKEVAEYLDVSVKTVWRYVEAGKFPKPKKYPGGRAIRWDPKKIEAWFNKLPDKK